jgi:hypothetical protein
LVREVTLTGFEDQINETGEFSLEAPTEAGLRAWNVVFPPRDAGGALHEKSSNPVVFTVTRHSAGIAVWDVRCPVSHCIE